jgi:protein involved in polysaccharide export with SLBB domain
MLYDWLALPNSGSEADTTNTNVPGVVGVPVIVAVLGWPGLNDIPGGNAPVKFQVVGPFPFVKMVVEYSFVVNPAGSAYVPGAVPGGVDGVRVSG